MVKWTVEFHRDFDREFDALPGAVQDAVRAHAYLLEQFGPLLGRPHVDTLGGSRHANMKELRFYANDGVWRVAFAFDPKRRAVLLMAGDKSGGGQERGRKSRGQSPADARHLPVVGCGGGGAEGGVSGAIRRYRPARHRTIRSGVAPDAWLG